VRCRASLGVIMAGEAVGVVAMVGVTAMAGDGAGAVGDGVSDGRTGDLDGGSDGVPGSTIPIGMHQRRHTTTIRIMARIMTGPTIRPTGMTRLTTLTCRGATGTRQVRPTTLSALARPYELIKTVSCCLPPAIRATTSDGDGLPHNC